MPAYALAEDVRLKAQTATIEAVFRLPETDDEGAIELRHDRDRVQDQFEREGQFVKLMEDDKDGLPRRDGFLRGLRL